METRNRNIFFFLSGLTAARWFWWTAMKNCRSWTDPVRKFWRPLTWNRCSWFITADISNRWPQEGMSPKLWWGNGKWVGYTPYLTFRASRVEFRIYLSVMSSSCNHFLRTSETACLLSQHQETKRNFLYFYKSLTKTWLLLMFRKPE